MIAAFTIRAALQQPNIQAFLRVIRQGETDQTDRAYFRVNGRPDLTDLARHPYHGIPTTRGARASGAYQFLGTTWAGLCDQYPSELIDFSQGCQDFGAVGLIAGRGALADVIEGQLEAAIRKCRLEWTSLPGAAENSGRYTLAKAKAVFEQYGGTLSGAESPQPEEEETMSADRGVMGTIGDGLQAAAPVVGAFNPIAGGAMYLLNSLLQVFQPLARDKIAKELNRHTDDPAIGIQIADGVVKKAMELTGKTDPVEAIAAAKSSVEIVSQLEASALDTLDKLAPVLERLHKMSQDEWAATEASRNAAQARYAAAPWDPAKLLIERMLWIYVGLLVCTAGLIAFQVWIDVDHKPMGELVTLFITLAALAGSKVGTIIDNRFGSSASSAAKDATIQQLSRVNR